MFQVPATHDEWNIERGFNSRWNFPGAYGAIDGKHVMIRAPPDCGSDFYNYKGSNSIILLAVVDHDYCFSYINVGANGKCSDGGVFQNSSILKDLENGMLPTGGFFCRRCSISTRNVFIETLQTLTSDVRTEDF